MVHRLQAQHVFRYQSFFIDKNQPLGHGSYGAVYKAKCDQLPCAAKLLHTTILYPTDPGADKIMQRFQQECALLESIRHPNIVQYLGITMDPDSRLPVLIMELLDESLTKMLERSQQPLPYDVQVDICHDIALAVAYLHSNDIIHRDLSSNNVLMIAGRRAKVTDFGMSKLAGTAPTMTPLTMCPGTLAYMSPEALREPPRYTKKLDCFSEGVIMIQVCTRLWPEPGPRTNRRPDPTSPTGEVEVPVLETERRKNHIEKIDPNHALVPIAKQCLRYQERQRPSSEELCQRLAVLKESRVYRASVKNQSDDLQVKDNQTTSQDQQLLEKDREIQTKTDQLRQMNQRLQEKEDQLRLQQVEKREIQTRHQREKSELQEKIASQERQLRQLNQQLEEQERITAEIQQTNYPPQKQVEPRQLSQQYLRYPQPPKMMLTWREGREAPFKMSRGAAVVDGNMAYFMHWDGEVCSYTSTTKRWHKLHKYPYWHASLVVINGHLTAIGGCENILSNKDITDKLYCLWGSWKVVYPPMPTKRYSTTAVTIRQHLIVAGGVTQPRFHNNIATVEVMDTKTLVWSTVASLPHPCSWGSAAICGDRLYMLGGLDDKGKTKSVLTCSLTELLQSSSSSSSSSVWHRVADAPAYYSTCVAVNGELLTVGGRHEDKAVADIHKYNKRTTFWEHMRNIPTARSRCLVAILPTNEMMVTGGDKLVGSRTDKVEIANIRFS